MSGNSGDMGSIGVDEPIASLIRRHFPSYPESRIRQLATDPGVALTAIRVKQEQSDQSIETEETDVEATYYAETYTVTADGPRTTDPQGNLEEPSNVEGKMIDLGFDVDTFDLRGFEDDVNVAFKSPNTTHREITYRAQDEPLAGITARSRYLWLWRADSATSNPTVHVEGWRDR